MTAVGHAPVHSGMRAAVRRQRANLKIALDPVRVSLFLLTVITISRVHEYLKLSAIRPALLLFALSCGFAVFLPRSLAWKGLFRTWPAKVLIALGLFACISAPFGISIGGSGQFILFEYSKVLLFSLLLMAAIRGAKDLFLFVWAYVIACGLLAWMATFVFGLSKGNSYNARLSNLYTYDANDLGCVLMAGLPLALLTFQTSGKKGKLASAMIIMGIGVSIARSGSRGAFVGLVVVGVALLLTLTQVPVSKRLGFLGAVVAALIVAAPQGYWEQIKTIASPKQDYNWTDKEGRKAVAERGMGYLWSAPLTGIGIDNFQRAEGTISGKHATDDPYQGSRWGAAHNSFLQAAAELGIPGFLLWSSLIFGGMFSMVRLRRRLPVAWVRGDPEQRFLYFSTMYLPAAILGFAITAFFVSFAWMDLLYVLAAFVTGVLRSVDRKTAAMAAAAVSTPAQVPRSIRSAPPQALPARRPRPV